jgi:hypothetical protein
MNFGEKERARALRGLRIYFAHRRWPRMTMSVIVAASGGVGFAASFFMLKAGLTAMALRYPLAVFAAWGVFLALMWFWAQAERRWFLPQHELEQMLRLPDPGERDEAGLEPGRWWDWLSDVPRALSLDAEGCAVGVIVLTLLVVLSFAVAGVITIVLAAPALIAEVFLDAVLATALYRRIQNIDNRWWLGGAIAQTAGPVAWTALLLAALGLIFACVAPGAQSIGGVWLHYHPVPLERQAK